MFDFFQVEIANWIVTLKAKLYAKDQKNVQGNESADGGPFVVQHVAVRHDGSVRTGQAESHVPGAARRSRPEDAIRIRRTLPPTQSRIRGTLTFHLSPSLSSVVLLLSSVSVSFSHF